MEDKIEIRRGETTTKVFDFGTGKLVVTSEPPGAEIAVDEKPRGVTPMEVELVAGTHRVTARYQDRPPEEQSVTVEKNQEAHADFEFANGSVKIISAPAGVRRCSGMGRNWGTPLLIEDLKPGTVSYELRLSGFKPATVTGTVQAKRQVFPGRAPGETFRGGRKSTVGELVRHALSPGGRNPNVRLGNAGQRLAGILSRDQSSPDQG